MLRVVRPLARGGGSDEPRALLAECRRRSIELLHRNLTPAGVLAATPGSRARRFGYTAIFARDQAICSLAMALSGDAELRHRAAGGLATLAEHQAPNGQIPKFVDVERREADFWYVGCIDATLWYLIAIAHLEALGAPRGIARAHARRTARGLEWLAAQEHPRLKLLQQNEASDWADIMPRSGFVLYTNALWHHVKRLYRVPGADATRASFNALFHPFSRRAASSRRARLLAEYPRRRARDRDLYLSFVNLAVFGDEGDVFGNLLAVLLGLADARARDRTMRALAAAQVHHEFPARTVVRPIRASDSLWRAYMARHRQNLVWQYHNGGIWPMVGGFWVMALVASGRLAAARRELVKLARACALGNWRFTEWLHGRTLAMRGMAGQSWSAAGCLLAFASLEAGANPLAHPTKRDARHT
ncbi:MAG TPA: glycoside hydrolase 100 family protein [Steroidobacteraceae bacterium]|nr:glycoside hydrolase 100 family protein [Steroidobacteraceae bacterium]